MTDTAPRRPRGRPPIGDRVDVRLSSDILATIEKIAAAKNAKRAEVLREIITSAVRHETGNDPVDAGCDAALEALTLHANGEPFDTAFDGLHLAGLRSAAEFLVETCVDATVTPDQRNAREGLRDPR